MSEERWSEAIEAADEHASDRAEAARAAEERDRPRSSAPRVLLLLVVCALVLGWNVVALTSPPPVPTPDEQETDLAWMIVGAVEFIEAYRSEDGRLPSAEEANEIFDDETSYRPAGEGYTVVAETEAARLQYDSATPLEAWMAARGMERPAGDGA